MAHPLVGNAEVRQDQSQDFRLYYYIVTLYVCINIRSCQKYEITLNNSRICFANSYIGSNL